MMSDKNRERKCNKEKYKQKQRKKKKMQQERRARAISRDLRNYVRSSINPYYDAFRNLTDKHLLFVIKDTENMERILFQKNNIGRGITLLSLPSVDDNMIEAYLQNSKSQKKSKSFQLATLGNEAINDITSFYFGVRSDEITDLSNLVIFRNCKLIGHRNSLIPLNVRPYNLNTWYCDDTTTLHGYRIYKGNKLKTFFHIDGELGKTYVFHDTLMEILLYRSMMGKIRIQDLLSDSAELGRRQLLSMRGLYEIIATNKDEIQERFDHEWQENMALNRE